MDNRRTMESALPSEVVSLTGHRSAAVPDNGFEVIEGVQTLRPDFTTPRQLFLTPRPGSVRRIEFPDDLYAHFANLRPEPLAILRFANTYGLLRWDSEHFHRSDNMQAQSGEFVRDWQLEILRVQETFELWHHAQAGTKADVQWIRRHFEPLWDTQPTHEPRGILRGLLQIPQGLGAFRNDPLLLARRVVVATVNFALAPGARFHPQCYQQGCGFKHDGFPDLHSQAYGTLRITPDEGIQLAIVSSDLLKTVWLQIAAYIAGQRKLKKCEAPDCGKYMDVTDSPRPGARRMHPSCEERIRKQRYRKNKRSEQP